MVVPSHPTNAFATVSEVRSRRVRSLISRRFGMALLAGVLLCVVVVWQRDVQSIERAKSRVARHVAALNAYLASNHALPASYPPGGMIAGAEKADDFRYVSPSVIRWARTADVPVLIGYERTTGLIARPDGHAVAYYHQGAVRCEWIDGVALRPILDQQEASASQPPP